MAGAAGAVRLALDRAEPFQQCLEGEDLVCLFALPGRFQAGARERRLVPLSAVAGAGIRAVEQAGLAGACSSCSSRRHLRKGVGLRARAGSGIKTGGHRGRIGRERGGRTRFSDTVGFSDSEGAAVGKGDRNGPKLSAAIPR